MSPGRREQELVLRVRDNGCGFETDNTAARGRGSVGLELLAALVTSHGGTLSIDAAPGQGTELVLRVPLPSAPSPTADLVQEQDAHEQDLVGALR